MLLQHNFIIPPTWPSLTVEANQAFNLTSFALSLLLVFRYAPAHPCLTWPSTPAMQQRQCEKLAGLGHWYGSILFREASCYQC